MKKLLLALGSIAAMIIVSSCSSESLEDATKETSINKKQFSPAATINAVSQDTIPQTITEPIDDEDPYKP